MNAKSAGMAIGLLLPLLDAQAPARAAAPERPIRFAAPRGFAVGDGPVSLATGDFNRDGRLDLLAVNVQSADLSLLIGNGAGGFAPAASLPAGDLPAAAAVADFDADGNLDLAVIRNDHSSVAMMAGDATANSPRRARSWWATSRWLSSRST